jgi:hypothetical protein
MTDFEALLGMLISSTSVLPRTWRGWWLRLKITNPTCVRFRPACLFSGTARLLPADSISRWLRPSAISICSARSPAEVLTRISRAAQLSCTCSRRAAFVSASHNWFEQSARPGALRIWKRWRSWKRLRNKAGELDLPSRCCRWWASPLRTARRGRPAARLRGADFTDIWISRPQRSAAPR